MLLHHARHNQLEQLHRCHRTFEQGVQGIADQHGVFGLFQCPLSGLRQSLLGLVDESHR